MILGSLYISLKIRDIRQRLYLHSADVWTPTEKNQNRIHLTTCRGGSLLLNEDKYVYTLISINKFSFERNVSKKLRSKLCFSSIFALT